jgi:hypothetical protein
MDIKTATDHELIRTSFVIAFLAAWLMLPGRATAATDAPYTPSRQFDVHLESDGTPVMLDDRIVGVEFVDYLIEAIAGQTLSIEFEANNRFAFFNLIPPATHIAIFSGAMALNPNQWSGVLHDSGVYTMRVFLMRNAARRNEVAEYHVEFELRAPQRRPLGGQVLTKDADFDAAGTVQCSMDADTLESRCGFGVYRGASSVTVYVEKPGEMPERADRILIYRDSSWIVPRTEFVDAVRRDDNWKLGLDRREWYLIPDALLAGD